MQLPYKSDKTYNSEEQSSVSHHIEENILEKIDYSDRGIKWNNSQNSAYLKYWLSEFLNHPLKMYSSKSPLSRDKIFASIHSKLSAMFQRQGKVFSRDQESCKSRHLSMKRIVRKKKIKNKDYDFIDYILEESSYLKKFDKELELKYKQYLCQQENQSKFSKSMEELKRIEEDDSEQNQQKKENEDIGVDESVQSIDFSIKDYFQRQRGFFSEYQD